MIGESRQSPGGGVMSVEQVERELARLRMNEDGTLGLRASVLNLIVVSDDESAPEITGAISELSHRYPSRTVVLISDPEEDRSLDVQLSAFCSIRGGGGAQVCAEQITIHAGGPPAEHLESLAGPLLIPDLPVFLWYPGPFSPNSPEFAGMAPLADRLIVDPAASGDAEASLREMAGLLEEADAPAIGDLQWVALSPWRALISALFEPPERAGELKEIQRVEVLHTPSGECRALLLVGWLASALGWKPESARRADGGREIELSGPSNRITVVLDPNSPDARLRRVRLHTGELSFQVSRHRELSDVRTTVMRGDELLGERTVHVNPFDMGVLLEEELQYHGRDHAYEAALRTAVEILDL